MIACRSFGFDGWAATASSSYTAGASMPAAFESTPADPATPGPVSAEAAIAARPSTPWPKVTVAILAYNRRDAVRVTLGKVLGELHYPREALEVIVVDNASSDGTADMVGAEFPAVRLLRLKDNLGLPAVNRAFAAAAGSWILVLDDDCWIDGEALQQAVAAAEANGADRVAFKVRSSEDPSYYFDEAYRPGLLGFWGCAWMISRGALDRLGGFDPNIFIWGNETELTMRALSAGFGHLFLPQVVAVHMKPPPPSTFDLRGHQINMRHWAYTAAKLMTLPDAAVILIRLVLIVSLDVFAITPRAARSAPEAIKGFLTGLRAREPIRPAVSALYRENFMSFANPLGFLRSPVQRLSDARRRGDPATKKAEGGSQRELYEAQREHLYPVQTAMLRL